MKRFLSIVFIMIMVFALVVPSFAEGETYTITINPSDQSGLGNDNRFEAYCVFTGKVSAGEKNDYRQLSEIEWGNGVDSASLMSLLDVDGLDDVLAILTESFVDEFACVAAEARIEANKYVSTRATLDGVWTIEVNDPGYYLIIDTFNSATDGEGVRSSYILDVVYDREVNLKASLPTVEKEVSENVSDSAVGTTFTYTLTGTVAENIADYKSYKYMFTDTPSAGITIDYESVRVKISNVSAIGDSYRVRKNMGTTSFTIEFTDLIAAAKAVDVTVDKDTVVEVTYTGALNDDLSAGSDGNANSVELSYSNNPYYQGAPEDEPLAWTTASVVKVYTFGLDITKIDGTNNAYLEGAQFVLMDEQGHYAVVAQSTNIQSWADDMASATTLESDEKGKIFVNGLTEGAYTLREVAAPDGYSLNKEDITFTISADMDENGELLSVGVTSKSKDVTDNNGDGIIEIRVKNYRSSAYSPTTNVDTNATPFIVSGSILIAISVAMMIHYSLAQKKREDRE